MTGRRARGSSFQIYLSVTEYVQLFREKEARVRCFRIIPCVQRGEEIIRNVCDSLYLLTKPVLQEPSYSVMEEHQVRVLALKRTIQHIDTFKNVTQIAQLSKPVTGLEHCHPFILHLCAKKLF